MNMKRIVILSGIAILITLSSCAFRSGVVRNAAQQKPKVSFKARDHFLKGLYYQQEGQYNQALVEYYQALHFDSTSATIYRTIGENYMLLGHYEMAESMLKKALQLDRSNPRTLDFLVECALRQGDNAKAARYLEAYLKVKPYDDQARQMLILLYQQMGKDLDVARQNRILIQLYGPRKDLLVKQVQIYIKTKKLDLAAQTSRTILRMDSTDSRSYFLLGLIKEQKMQLDSAIYYYQRALKFQPDFAQALERLAFLYQTQKKWQDLVPYLKRAIRADTTYTSAKIMLGETYFYLNKYDSSRAVLLPLLKQPDIPLGVYELLGRIELNAKHYQLAKSYFKKIVDQDTTYKMGWLLLAFTYSDMDSTQRAADIFKNLAQKYPDDALIWSFYGNTLQSLGQYDKAVKAFQTALKLQPDNESALGGLAVIYENRKQFARCDSIYEVGIQRLPESAMLLNNYSYSLAERGKNLQKALELAQKAITLEPNNAAYLDTYGWVLYKLGKYKQAAEYIKKSIELRANSAVVIEHLGDVYKAMGENTKALEYYKKAFDLKPDDKKLEKKIEEITNE